MDQIGLYIKKYIFPGLIFISGLALLKMGIFSAQDLHGKRSAVSIACGLPTFHQRHRADADVWCRVPVIAFHRDIAMRCDAHDGDITGVSCIADDVGVHHLLNHENLETYLQCVNADY